MRKEKLEEMEEQDVVQTAINEIQARLDDRDEEKRKHEEYLDWLRTEAFEQFQVEFERNKKKNYKETTL